MTNEQQKMVFALIQHRKPMPTYTADEVRFLKSWYYEGWGITMSVLAADRLERLYTKYRDTLEKSE